ARHALEPLVNLARLHIRDSEGERALRLIDTLYKAVSSRTNTTIEGIQILAARLAASPEAHKEVRRWLRALLLATGARALAVAGRWDEAITHLRHYKGIGRRMLDGRQVAVIAHTAAGATASALALLNDTDPGEPWESAVTACLTLVCRRDTAEADLGSLLDTYNKLDVSTPGLAVFHIRLGLSFTDALGSVEHPRAHDVAIGLIDRTTASRDGYAAHELLSHRLPQPPRRTPSTGTGRHGRSVRAGKPHDPLPTASRPDNSSRDR
ncbi:hypothetical protein ACI2LP_32845, partial [Streptomyces sp. NPDC019890]